MSSLLNQCLEILPSTDSKVLSVLSGGLDSSILTMLLVRKYGAHNVIAVSYDYRQKQRLELEKAARMANRLGVAHKVFDLGLLGDIAQPISANVSGTSISMPTIKEVVGDPQPVTYVPFRNLILLSLTLAQAEASNARYIFTGLQVHDEYGYWDTSERFVNSVNEVAAMNRTQEIEILAPFASYSKACELRVCQELGCLDFLVDTLTCYEPDKQGRSCGKCPSCSERIMNFAQFGHRDPIPYAKDIPWDSLIKQHSRQE